MKRAAPGDGAMLGHPPNRSMARPPRAVVGSQISRDEEMFGAAFDGRVFRRFFQWVRPYRLRLGFAVVAVVIYTGAQLSLPLVIRHMIDGVLLAGGGRAEAIATGFLFLAVTGLSFGAGWAQDRLVSIAGERIVFDLRRAMFVHLQRVALSFMERTEVGRMMSRLQGDVNALQEFLEMSVTTIGDVLLLIGIVAILISLDVGLGMLSLSVVLALLVVRLIWLPRARQAFRRARETHAMANGALAEGIHAVRTVQGMRREAVNLDLYDDKAAENLRAQLRSGKLAQIMVPIVDSLTGLALAIVVVVGGLQVLAGDLEIGVMVAFLFYVQRFFDPIRSLTIQYSVMQRAVASGQRIFEVLDVPIAMADAPDAFDPPTVKGRITLNNVTFGYNRSQPVLRNVSFDVAPGETVALVGPTGSGKTSITALLHRFYDAGEGSVEIDGRDVRTYARAALGRHIAMVLQDPFLFTGSVLDNIRFRTTDASRADIELAAEAVGAHEFIARLPHGYDTVLDQQGRNLSLGQRQLISIARALVADAPILVLDEATASIDSYTERKIQIALKRLLAGRTGLVIAHRLATVRNADRIIVLREGRIVETGTHDQLLRAQGLYARLYRLNYASFDDLEEAAEAADHPPART